jgi:DNA-binding GntR family transcriptional regulator
VPQRISNLTELPKQSLRERVSRALRAAIISGELEPGEVYSAPFLATRFGVSATPVREAMLDLARENLVTTVANKGFRVTVVDDTVLDQITQIRLLIEPPTLAQVTPEIPEEDFPELEALAQKIVDEAEAGDLVEYTQADQEFHLKLLSYAANPRIVDLVTELRGQTRLLGLTALLEQGELTNTALEHRQIVELLRSRDPRAVEEFMRRHIGQVRTLWAGPAGDSTTAAGGR